MMMATPFVSFVMNGHQAQLFTIITMSNDIKDRTHYRGSATRLKKRRLSEKTCESSRSTKKDNTSTLHYHNKNGQLIGAKVRKNLIRTSPTKVNRTDLSLVNTYGRTVVSELSLLKESLMQHRTELVSNMACCIITNRSSRSQESSTKEL